MMKYASLALGMIEAVFNKLGGIEGAQRFLSGKLTLKPAEERSFDVWKTVDLGVAQARTNFRQVLGRAGKMVGEGGPKTTIVLVRIDKSACIPSPPACFEQKYTFPYMKETTFKVVSFCISKTLLLKEKHSCRSSSRPKREKHLHESLLKPNFAVAPKILALAPTFPTTS